MEVGLGCSHCDGSDLAFPVWPFGRVCLCVPHPTLMTTHYLTLSLLLGMLLKNIHQGMSTCQSQWDWMPGIKSQPSLPGYTLHVQPSKPRCFKGSNDDVGPLPRICLLNWITERSIHGSLVVIILVHMPQDNKRTISDCMKPCQTLKLYQGVKSSQSLTHWATMTKSFIFSRKPHSPILQRQQPRPHSPSKQCWKVK